MAMLREKPTKAVQENIICLLCHNDEVGKIVAGLVDTALFEGDYRVIAERAMAYWKKHNEAPKFHTPDLVSDILEDKRHAKARTYANILDDMLALAPHVNTDYILDQVRTFVRTQRLKEAVIRSAEKLNAKAELAVSEVEGIWSDLLRARETAFVPGMRLSDVDRFMSYFETHQTEFETGVKALDDAHVVPIRGGVMLFLGGTGKGKSWFLVNAGKRALLRGKKVLHISLEMSEEEVVQRYYQSLFSIAKRDVDIPDIARFVKDKYGKFSTIEFDPVEPEFALTSGELKLELSNHLEWLGTKLNNLVVKRFPTRQLTIAGLRAYIDTLEATEGFIPDEIILDYIGIMATDVRNHRLSLGRNLEEYRGICVERNVAGVTAHQGSKMGFMAREMNVTHVGEDWSLITTSDIALVHSATDEESEFGLGRLYVGKCRGEKDKWGVLLTQNYGIGQYCIDSLRLPKTYFEELKELTGGKNTDALGGDGEDDEE